MYESHYGLRTKPFALTPDPEFLYLARHHRRALLQLEFGLANQAVFVLITGEVGSGKTTLIRYLLGRIDQNRTVGLITNTTRESGRLLQWICAAFGLDIAGKDDATLHVQFAEFLSREHVAGHQVVLVVDEAQNLGATRLEELRVLSNLNVGRDVLLQIILVGQPELRKLMRSPRLRQFAQRIGAEYHIGRLSEPESVEYVQHRLRVAGSERGDIFDAPSVALAHESSRGIPRLLNQLCDTALVYGYAEDVECIDATLMQEVISDRCAGGVFPGLLIGPAAAQSGA
jgi:type II secretory pathway predicted ATPase ExeA